jgi:phosphonate utilization transcriptional regulator
MSDRSASRPAALDLVRTQSLTSLVQAEIDRQITTGELAAGKRINEIALSERLGISRGPIREACRALVQAGLLEAVRNRGVFVRQIGPAEMADVYDIRAALDNLAGRTLAERITKPQVATLRQLVKRMDQAAKRQQISEYYPLNLEFHRSIIDFAGNQRLAQIYGGLVKELFLSRRRGLVEGGGLHFSNAEHKKIVDALEARDPDLAASLMQGHVLEGKKRALAVLAQVDAAAAAKRDPAA